ncbi:MAG: MetQ/NlpA family ABC transporter substrate-binding protein, partial [Eubacteriales bacterium]
ANYFQHVPYLDNFNVENGTHIVSVSAVHVEPMGVYSSNHTTLDDITK